MTCSSKQQQNTCRNSVQFWVSSGVVTSLAAAFFTLKNMSQNNHKHENKDNITSPTPCIKPPPKTFRVAPRAICAIRLSSRVQHNLGRDMTEQGQARRKTWRDLDTSSNREHLSTPAFPSKPERRVELTSRDTRPDQARRNSVKRHST